MKIRYKKFDKSLPSPNVKTKGSAATDLYTRETVTVDPGQVLLIPLNVAVEIPEGYFGLLVARSSLHKMGLMPANAVGVVDSDYRGDSDEIKFLALNFTNHPVTVEQGTRIAQLLVLKHEALEFEEHDQLGNADRGGIGSTGNK